jgi:dTMP kinase
MKPTFFVLCGGEGSGKSSLVKALKEKYPEVVFSREPGGSEYGEHIRELMFKNSLAKFANAETMFALFWGARADHMHHLIVPAVKKGKSVIVDRFDVCTYAYQLHAQGGGHLEDLFWATRQAFLGDNAPDVYILLDVPVEIGMKRVAERNTGKDAEKSGDSNHFDARAVAFHEAVRDGYFSFFKKLEEKAEKGEIKKSKVVLVDATQSFEAVLKDVIHVIDTTVSAETLE